MYPRVTAVIVAHNGAAHLERTLEALRAQTRQPDAVVAIDGRSKDSTGKLLADFGPTKLIQVNEPLSFGQAVQKALSVMPDPANDDDWLWLLAQDSAPEPGALAALLGAVEVAPSVAVAGPKQMDWLRPSYIRGYGESVTRFGTTVHLVEDELDQGQHDRATDVLAVAAGGMLVRHSLWVSLGGFDAGLANVDDALDFCVRTRLAGFRVVRVPEAKVSTARIGLQTSDGKRIGRGERRRARHHRAAQLHRRMAYAAAILVPLHWLSLLPITIGRVVMRLLRKQPGLVGGEILAALVVGLGGTKILRARSMLHRRKTAAWSSLAPLRIPFDVVRQLRSTRHDAIRVASAREYHPLRFFGGGGVWVALTALVASLAIFAPLIAASGVGGGGLLPLSPTVAELWQNAAYGYRDIGAGFIGAPDPFAAVLALLGTLTFWSPSYSLVLLQLLAIPLAATGAWFMVARLTARPDVRAVAGLLWAFAPPLLIALGDGRPGAVIAHVLLPWLFFAGFSAYRSWSAAGASTLLAAGVVASAPSLAPALLVIWLVVVAVSKRRIGRYIGMPIPAAVLALPLVLAQGTAGSWWSLLADPGVPLAYDPSTIWQLLTGIPGAALGGWTGIATGWGLPPEAAYLVPLLLFAPLLLAAIGALAIRRNLRGLGAVAVAAAGLVTAFGAQSLGLTTTGATEVLVWPGSGLSLFWLGVVLSASLALAALPRLRVVAGLVVAAAAAVAVAPLATAFPSGDAQVRAAEPRAVPAFVSAEAAVDPRLGTLVLVPQSDGGVEAQLVRGQGATLDSQSTLVATGTQSSEDLVVTAGNLASRSGLDVTAELATLGIRFVVLAPAETTESASTGETEASTEAASVYSRAAVALDGNPSLAPVGETAFGLLWSVDQTAAPIETSDVPTDVVGPFGRLYLLGLLVVFGVAVLLALPTGFSMERGRSNAAVAGIDDEPAEATGQYDAGDERV